MSADDAYAEWSPVEELSAEDRVKAVRLASKLLKSESWKQVRAIARCGPLSNHACNELAVGIAVVACGLMNQASILPALSGTKRVTAQNIHQAGEFMQLYTPTLKLQGGHRVDLPSSKESRKKKHRSSKKKESEPEEAAAAASQESSSSKRRHGHEEKEAPEERRSKRLRSSSSQRE